MGNAVKKRRQATRPKNRRKTKAKQVVKKQEPHSWINEALAVTAFAVAAFMLLSLISHSILIKGTPWDYAQMGSGHLRNLMGPVGHFFATLTFGLFGWSSLVLVGFMGWLGVYCWNYEDDSRTLAIGSRLFVVLGLVMLLLSSCVLLALYFGIAGGGKMGMTIAGPISSYVGMGGGVLFLLSLLLVSVALATQQSLATIVTQLYRTVLKACALLFLTLPRIAYLLVNNAIVYLVDGFYLLSRYIAYSPLATLWQRDTDDEEEEALPRPKKRRNQVPSDPEPESESEGAGVVVERKVLKNKDQIALLKKRRQSNKKQLFLGEKQTHFVDYKAPDLKLLKRGIISGGGEDDEELKQKSAQIEAKLRDFNIAGRVTHVHPGPVITLFEFEPAAGVKVGKITALQDDLAMSLRAHSVRILAPIPKRGTVGIEVPNKQRDVVRLRDVMESRQYMEDDSLLCVPIGKDTYGNPVVSNIAAMPHLLMAGATGSGKSVCINAMLISLLYGASPAELGLILIDPKILELSIYEGIPHLKVPVVTEHKKAKAVLQWAANEMERRYVLLQRFGVRNIDGYNKIASGEDAPEDKQDEAGAIELSEEAIIEEGDLDALNNNESKDQDPDNEEAQFSEVLEPLPKIVIVIDELADLMLTVGREIEELITRLAQKARAAGIHLIIATQRPSVDVITGLIKANFPARISFRVSSRIDSRTILDSIGSEKLLGMGDMLFMSPGDVHLKRIHGAFVSDSEVKDVVEALKKSCPPAYDDEILEMCEKALEEEGSSFSSSTDGEDEYDPLYDQAVNLILEKGQASTSMVQRAFRIGYNRAARIIDMMEQEGIVGPMDGSKPRQILLNKEE